MIDFKPIASGSNGNAYIVRSGRSCLLLECGIKMGKIIKALDGDLKQVEGCLITHEHSDHARSVKDLSKRGINCYMSKGTADAVGIKHHRIKRKEARKKFKIGTFTILPFEVEHDVNEPFGYLIRDEDGDTLLFATDTYFIRYQFPGINLIAIECNYSEDILRENILEGRTPVGMRRRLERSHFSLENCKNFLAANDLSQVREIWLLHMSYKNGDAEQFKREIMGQTKIPVKVWM